MDTLVLDLQCLISNHLTIVEDVLVKYCNHYELKNIETVVRVSDWRSILYYLQRYGYRAHILKTIYLMAMYRNNNDKLTNLLGARYNLDLKTISDVKQNIKAKREFGGYYSIGSLFDVQNQKYHAPIDLEIDKHFDIVVKHINNYYTNNARNFDITRCNTALLAIVNEIMTPRSS